MQLITLTRAYILHETIDHILAARQVVLIERQEIPSHEQQITANNEQAAIARSRLKLIQGGKHGR